MKQLIAAIRKEMLLQWRTRAQILAIFIFGATALLLFSFAIGPNSSALRLHAPGFLWLGLLLSSTLALSESFQLETEQKGLEGLLLLPASPRALYYAKAIANMVQLSILGAALIPVMIVLYDVGVSEKLFGVCGVIVLGAAGLSAPGTIYSAMASQARAKQTLLPLLLFPLVVPVLLASVKATSLLIEGDPMGQLKSWVTLVTSFDLIYWSLCGLVFGRVVED
jgi:heme exporter protein B